MTGPRVITGAQAVIRIGAHEIKPMTLPYVPGNLSFTMTFTMTKRQRKQMRRFVCALVSKTARRTRKARS